MMGYLETLIETATPMEAVELGKELPLAQFYHHRKQILDKVTSDPNASYSAGYGWPLLRMLPYRKVITEAIARDPKISAHTVLMWRYPRISHNTHNVLIDSIVQDSDASFTALNSSWFAGTYDPKLLASAARNPEKSRQLYEHIGKRVTEDERNMLAASIATDPFESYTTLKSYKCRWMPEEHGLMFADAVLRSQSQIRFMNWVWGHTTRRLTTQYIRTALGKYIDDITDDKAWMWLRLQEKSGILHEVPPATFDKIQEAYRLFSYEDPVGKRESIYDHDFFPALKQNIENGTADQYLDAIIEHFKADAIGGERYNRRVA